MNSEKNVDCNTAPSAHGVCTSHAIDQTKHVNSVHFRKFDLLTHFYFSFSLVPLVHLVYFVHFASRVLYFFFFILNILCSINSDVVKHVHYVTIMHSWNFPQIYHFNETRICCRKEKKRCLKELNQQENCEKM